MSDLTRAIHLAQSEIQRLRQRNEVLEAKVEVMELFGLVFRTQPAWPTVGMGEDPVYLLQRELEKAASIDAKKEAGQ